VEVNNLCCVQETASELPYCLCYRQQSLSSAGRRPPCGPLKILSLPPSTVVGTKQWLSPGLRAKSWDFRSLFSHAGRGTLDKSFPLV
jgi:hypothetical protein